MRIERDHRTVRGASAERAGARIEHAIHTTAFVVFAVFVVACLTREVVIMADVKFPSQRLVLRRARMEGWHVVVLRQAVLPWRAHRAATLKEDRVAAGFEEENRSARFSQSRRDGSPAGAGADDHVFVLRGFAHRPSDRRAQLIETFSAIPLRDLRSGKECTPKGALHGKDAPSSRATRDGIERGARSL